MSNNQQFRWIVLVNKSPRGPLTEVDVRTLLAQGVVRHNDLAYRVDVDDPKEKSDWKLIWQFDEFNRRTPDSFAQKPEVEKRDAPPPEEVVKQNLSELPIDLADIAPEDLLPRSRAISAAAEEAKWNKIEEDAEASRPKMHLAVTIPKWAYGLLGVLAVSFFFFRWVSGKHFSTSQITPTMPAPEASNGEEHRPQTPRGTASRRDMRLSPVHGNQPPREIAPPAERPRDNNEPPPEREPDRDREREREEEAPPQEEAQNEGGNNGDENFERAAPVPGSRRPNFRKKPGGILEEPAGAPQGDPEAPIDGDPPRSDVPLPEPQ